ncbi:MAG: hypothetical protein AAF725_27740, partial [Acidobacteriota bacterium]
LRRASEERRASRAFAALHEQRERCGFPTRVFVMEKIGGPAMGPAYKPQYLDLSSPLFVDILFATLRADDADSITFEEALPSPEDYPAAGDGSLWALEVQVERHHYSVRAGADGRPWEDHSPGLRAARSES